MASSGNDSVQTLRDIHRDCPSCHTPVVAGWRFCPSCGSGLSLPREGIQREGIQKDGPALREETVEAAPVTPTAPGVSTLEVPAVPFLRPEVSGQPVRSAPEVRLVPPHIRQVPPIAPDASTPESARTVSTDRPTVEKTPRTDLPPPPVSATARDVSNQNTYNPLAKKRPGIPPWTIPALLVLLAVAIGVWRSIPRRAATTVAPATIQPTGPVSEVVPTPTPGDLTATSVAGTLPPNVSQDDSAAAAVTTGAPVNRQAEVTRPAPEPEAAAPITARPAGKQRSPIATAKVASTPGTARLEISSSEAQALLLNRLRTMRYYHVPPKCMSIDSVSFKNEGYTMSVRSASCKGDGKDSGALLGRWRVDAHTGESYVRNAGGHYVRP